MTIQYTVPQAAEILNLTERATWMKIYRGQIPHRRLGKRVFIPADELDTFLKNLPGVSAAEAVAKVEKSGPAQD